MRKVRKTLRTRVNFFPNPPFPGICLAIGILSFPAGWDNDHVRSICGESADYDLGTCGIRWALVLAVIAFLDCWILGCLAFTLSHRVVRPAQENLYMNSTLYKGNFTQGGIYSL